MADRIQLERAALHLAMANGFGPGAFHALKRSVGGPLEMMAASEDVVAGFLKKPGQLAAWKVARDAFMAGEDSVLAGALGLVAHGAVLQVHGDDAYPSRLAQVADAPAVLMMGGEQGVAALKAPCVGIVGTRLPSEYGARITREMAWGLAQHGVTVVSGAADGVDCLAHQGALDGGGLTVAVLGTPLGAREGNVTLRRRVVTQGACVTEMLPGQDQHQGAFAQRNRIISGLSDVVLIMEGTLDSGTRHTAQAALAQGRPLMALPGDITRVESGMPNQLLRDGKARALTALEDVLGALGVAVVPVAPVQEEGRRLVGRARSGPDTSAVDVPEGLRPLWQALRPGVAAHLDDVVRESGLPAADAASGMLELELLGVVRRAAGGLFQRVT